MTLILWERVQIEAIFKIQMQSSVLKKNVLQRKLHLNYNYTCGRCITYLDKSSKFLYRHFSRDTWCFWLEYLTLLLLIL